jgi:hypothetical protein
MFHFVESGVTADYGAITPSPCWVLFFAFIWGLGLQPHTNELKASVYWEVLDKLLSEKGEVTIDLTKEQSYAVRGGTEAGTSVANGF